MDLHASSFYRNILIHSEWYSRSNMSKLTEEAAESFILFLLPLSTTMVVSLHIKYCCTTPHTAFILDPRCTSNISSSLSLLPLRLYKPGINFFFSYDRWVFASPMFLFLFPLASTKRNGSRLGAEMCSNNNFTPTGRNWWDKVFT